MSVIWCIAALVFAITQKMYKGSILLCFGVGALITSLLSFIIHSALIQLLMFIFISLSFTLILTKKYSRRLSPSITKLHELIGKQALVIHDIGDTSFESGLIKLDDQVWHAVSSSGESIPEGSIVVVESITGIRVQVALPYSC